jgi:DNA-binding NarL/FixJ family response regulator
MFALSKEISKSYKTEKTQKKEATNNNPKKTTTICIINDSPTIREGIFSSIHEIADIKQIIKTSKKDYFDKHATKQIDIVITEIEFNNKVETSFVEQIKSINPDTRIIVYTKIENHAVRNYLLSNGADAFIFLRDINFFIEHIVKIMIRKNQRIKHSLSSKL